MNVPLWLVLVLAYLPPLLSVVRSKLGYLSITLLSITLASLSIIEPNGVFSYFLLLSSIVWLIISTFSLFSPCERLLEALLSLSISGMVTILESTNYLEFLVGWEVMSIPIYAYIAIKGNYKSAFVFIAFSEISTVLLLFSFIIASTQSMYFAPLSSPLPLIIGSIGFIVKMGVTPFMVAEWLPISQGNTPGNMSALISSTVTLMGVYGIVRMSSLTGFIPIGFPLALMILGAVTTFFGALYAYVSESIKGALAFSTVENNGAMLSELGIFMVSKSLGMLELEYLSLYGVILYSFAHSIAKTGLFLTSSLQGSTAISLAKKIRDKLYSIALVLISTSMSGLLPNLGGVSSWLLLELLFISAYILHNSSSIFFIISGFTIAMGEGFATAFMIKYVSYLSVFKRDEERVYKPLSVPIFTSGLLVFLLGFTLPYVLYPYKTSLLSLGMIFNSVLITCYNGHTFGGISPLYIVLMVATLSSATYIAFGRPKTRKVRTWNNGVVDQEEYTAYALSNNVRLMLRKILRHESVYINTDATDVVWKEMIRIGIMIRKIGKLVGRNLVNSSIQWYIIYLIITVLLIVVIITL
ncbi:proton-conducting transporter membrane subunit [Stygiolobus caldivivus]|uniref:Oxidoreductase n=1 Tax=Stygiolobus caldivivus TaxID=2824673 RepID=A0A8D5U6L4_9CREN|nr:proton-conducting transporter membrane subunit [Stygiolobus caldivivus]BCU70264.1 oxidoreductase [Stygiolobus caldivivus]